MRLLGPSKVGLWKNIRRGLFFFFFFLDFSDMRWETRSKTRFWHDLWCGDHP
jgi:hypothetical protein